MFIHLDSEGPSTYDIELFDKKDDAEEDAKLYSTTGCPRTVYELKPVSEVSLILEHHVKPLA